MLYGILITIHIIVCIFLITIVLIQAGRGGGLAESFTGAESIFGTKTNAVLTRATTFFAVFFFITCLSLAILAKQRSSSLIRGHLPQADPAPQETIPEKEKQPVPSEQPQAQPTSPEVKEGTAESKPQIKEKAADTQQQSQSQKSQ
jgi:preprotein translocase subunit SecG